MITRMVDVKGETYGYTGDKILKRCAYYGKYSDAKPTGVCVNNADIFYEMDTQDVYLYDAETSQWLKQ